METFSAGSKFCEGADVEIDEYTLHHKYLFKPHSAPSFLAACGAAIAHKNHFVHLCQQNKSSVSKAKFWQVSHD